MSPFDQRLFSFLFLSLPKVLSSDRNKQLKKLPSVRTRPARAPPPCTPVRNKPALNKSNPVRCHLCWMLFYAWPCRPRWREGRSGGHGPALLGGQGVCVRAAPHHPHFLLPLLVSPSLPLPPPLSPFFFCLPPLSTSRPLLLFRSVCTGRRAR